MLLDFPIPKEVQLKEDTLEDTMPRVHFGYSLHDSALRVTEVLYCLLSRIFPPSSPVGAGSFLVLCSTPRAIVW